MYHVETIEKIVLGVSLHYSSSFVKEINLEKLSSLSFGIYYIKMNIVEVHHLTNEKVIELATFTMWHECLGHPGTIMM